MNTLNQKKAKSKANKNIIKNFMGAQTRCLGTQSNEFQGILEYNKDLKGGDTVGINQLVRMLKALKKDGYTLEQIINLLEYITDTKNEYEGK